MIISEYEFVFYRGFKNASERYPNLKEGAFSMNLQAGEHFYTANVRYDFVFNDINIEFFDEQENLIQPRKRCASGINLFYLIGYYLVYDKKNNKFIFGSGSEDEVL